MQKLVNISSLSLVASAIALSLIFTGCGDTDPDNEGNHLPDVNIVQNNKTVNVGTKVNLTSTALDVDGDALTYEWKFVSKPTGSSATLTTTTTKKTSFTADKAGKYVIQFIAKDVVDAVGKDTVTIIAKEAGAVSNTCTSYTEISGTYTTDKTLDGCFKVVGDISVENNALLTIKAGSTLMFDDGRLLSVSKGALKAVGTVNNPILFTGMQKTAGYWYGINIRGNDTRNEIGYSVIEYAGGGHYSGALRGDGRMKIHDTVIKYSGSDGFNFDYDSIIDEFKNVTSTKNTLSAGIVSTNILGAFDNTSNFKGNIGHDYLKATGVNGDITSNQTWKPLTVPVFLTGDFDIKNKALLTIEAGASFICDNGFNLTVTDGALKAVGKPATIDKNGTLITPAKLITFTGGQKTVGYWDGLNISSNDTRNEIGYSVIEYAGGGHYSGALRGDGRIKVHDTKIQYSGSDGFNFSHDTMIDEFKNVTSTKNVKTAGLITTNNLHHFDNTSDFTGNLGGDYLTVDGYDIENDVTWKELTVPALMKSHFSITNNALVTIEAGASFVFDSDAYFYTTGNSGELGALKAIGTKNKPISFTGRQHTQGYWGGISFGNNDSRNEFAYVNIADGGGYYNGNIKIDEYANIHNCNISNSLNYGIWFNYQATSNNDISSVNTFSNNKKGNIGRD